MNKCILKNVLKSVKDDFARFFTHDIKYYIKDWLAVLAMAIGVICISALYIFVSGMIITRLFDVIPNTRYMVQTVGSVFFIASFILLVLGIRIYDYFSTKIKWAKRECNNED